MLIIFKKNVRQIAPTQAFVSFLAQVSEPTFLAIADSMTTRQKEVLQLHKEMEKLDSKMDSTIA